MSSIFVNICILIIFITFFILVSLRIRKYSYVIQGIVSIIFVIIAIAIDRLLLKFYKDYFVDQWYYSTSYSWKNGYGENIVLPFIFIGGIIYSLVQIVDYRLKSKRTK